MPINLVLIGPPGVGKGTQAGLLTERLGLVHLASGDVFRGEIAAGTDLGRVASGYIERGELVPDDVTIGMMESRFTTDEAKTSGFVLDGFPRTVAQAVSLDARLEALGTVVARVVSLEAPDDVVVARLSGRRTCLNCGAVFHIETMPPMQEGVCDDCGSELVTRTDDREETIRQRLAVFHTQTQPVLGYYAETGKLFRVDGRGTVEDVYRAAIGGLRV